MNIQGGCVNNLIGLLPYGRQNRFFRLNGLLDAFADGERMLTTGLVESSDQHILVGFKKKNPELHSLALQCVKNSGTVTHKTVIPDVHSERQPIKDIGFIDRKIKKLRQKNNRHIVYAVVPGILECRQGRTFARSCATGNDSEVSIVHATRLGHLRRTFQIVAYTFTRLEVIIVLANDRNHFISVMNIH